ncbi:MAG: hypothetical protein CM15mP57_1100 [Alphaproteobacteria bacterium]|nr:MAG: hypothetical protein CM15mP57_1100 [Alphaproteobacteria bacterium]
MHFVLQIKLELLDYQTSTNIETAIKETAKYIKKKGDKDFDYNFDIEIDNSLTPKTWKDKII